MKKVFGFALAAPTDSGRPSSAFFACSLANFSGTSLAVFCCLSSSVTLKYPNLITPANTNNAEIIVANTENFELYLTFLYIFLLHPHKNYLSTTEYRLTFFLICKIQLFYIL